MIELNEMQRMAGASQIALELQTKKNQQLQHEIAQLQQAMIDDLDRWMAEKKTILESRDRAEAWLMEGGAQATIEDLRAGISALTKENGDLKRQRDTSMVDALLSKDDELAIMAARVAALADQLEQAQAQLAATSRALNDNIAELDAARDWARAWKMAASKWFGALAPEPEAKP